MSQTDLDYLLEVVLPIAVEADDLNQLAKQDFENQNN
jgi:hypothetical protein